MLRIRRIIFCSAELELKAVAACDLLHKRMAMDGVPKYLILEMYWYFLVTSQIANGIVGCVHKFFGSISCSNVEKICEATLVIPCAHMMMVELSHVHQSAGVSVYLGPKGTLFLLERMHQLMMSLENHIVQVVQLHVRTHCVEMSVT